MQDVLAQVLEQDATGAVHDRLRLAGGARREQHVPRLVVGEQLELGARCRAADPPVPLRPHTPRPSPPAVGGAAPIITPRRTPSRSASVARSGDGVVLRARVGVLAGRDEYRGIELAETVDQRILAEVG